ncbi:MAG: AbrB family transcriptional regulator [Deltaproteobacteria bacterium RIFCSPLOWO2_02_FULL_53_8]|nr:MAG: AbrB family transcriptional regulator [Deltaproteobacteria bacterium RIFCSPLOWO2_02_FULL_53_8]
MTIATLTSKGQVTIPLEIREALNLHPKDKISFTPLPNNTVIMRVKRGSILDLNGILKAPEGVSVSIEDMNPFKDV